MSAEGGVLLPPPPPPDGMPSNEQLDQVSTFSTLRDMGYAVEYLSPWQLVTQILQDMIKERGEKNQVTESLMRSETDKRQLILELASHVNGGDVETTKEPGLKTHGKKTVNEARARTISELSARNTRLEGELARCRGALSDCQKECQRLASVASFATQGREAASSEVEFSQRSQGDAERLIERLSKALEDEKSKTHLLEDDVDRLKVELVKQEGFKQTIQHKLDRSLETIRLGDEAKKTLESALAASRDETKTINELLLEERRSKKTFKVRMEEIVSELESVRAELTKVDRTRANIDKAKLELEQQSGILKRQVSAQAEALATRDDELRQVHSKLESTERNLNEERKAHDSRLHEIRAAAQDVANMTRENRELARALEKSTNDVRELKIGLEESRAKHARLSGMLDAAKLERAELVSSIRMLTESKARMADELRSVADARADLVKEERITSDEVVDLTKKVVELEGTVRRLQADLTSAESRAEGLSREVRTGRATIQSLEEGKTLAERASGSEQQRFAQTSRLYDSIRAELEQTRTELGICAGRLEKAMDENKKQAEQLMAERIKVDELESQLERARIEQAKALISSGRAFASSSDRLKTPSGAQSATEAPSSRRRDATSGRTGGDGQSFAEESSTSTMREVDDQYEELERVLGDDLSEASSIIRQSREERQRRTPGTSFGRISDRSHPDI